VDFDLLVVGAGHAGAEAALAAARMGARCGCVVMDPAAIGRMSCNPAIGGIAKGQLVRELDALGGEMGLCADASGIQFRMINTRKGPAVRSPRAQCDRELYNQEMRSRLQAQDGLSIVTGEAVGILVKEEGELSRVAGVRLADGQELFARSVVLTTGTFLGGRLFAGDWEESGGRLGEAGASQLSRSLEALGLRLARHKTGTPPRLARSSIDFAALEEQPGDSDPQAFSFRTEALPAEQVCCHVTRSTARTHEIIAASAHLSPMYQGRIKGLGPRYCPSIEDKVMRFPERDSHRIFLEPEGRDSDEIYPNGISTSLPLDVQRAFLSSIPGLEKVEMLRPGYAVEYDFLCTDQIRGDLQVAGVQGLFAAGQINGTSGYEEAAAQGLMAGINAVLHLRGEPAFILDRSSSYIGVMIDDLCRVNPREPYRMFTSRAEYRLLLRSDNADRRLSAKGHELGLLPASQMQRVAAKEVRIVAGRSLLASCRREGRSLEELLRRPEQGITDFLPELSSLDLSPDELSELEAEIKYAGYIERQRRDVERLRRMEARRIPRSFDYSKLSGLSAEARERLLQRRPLTIGEAGRLAGVTPSDVNLLLASMARR
jgi:tRNA uridine 5-carboxymethylaminomethyl modification enzyme